MVKEKRTGVEKPVGRFFNTGFFTMSWLAERDSVCL